MTGEVHCGKIICKCKLVDSIYMTSDCVKKVQKEKPNENKYGYYEVGRYAWVFEDKYEKYFLQKIDEGWHLQSIKEVIENRVGAFFD